MLKIFALIVLLSSGTIGIAVANGIFPVQCIYSFSNPTHPSFTLPSPQPNSPGDVQLNHNNPLRLANGSRLAAGQGCNSRGISYFDFNFGRFVSTYIDSTGRNTSFADVIYATKHDQVFARTIQADQANLASFLAERMLKIDLDCNNGLLGCAYFTINGRSFNSSPGPFLNGCSQSRLSMTFIMLLGYHVFRRCIRPVTSVFVSA